MTTHAKMDNPKPANFLSAQSQSFRYVEKSNPQTSNLQLLTYGVYELAGPVKSGWLAHPNEEALLFCLQDPVAARVDGREYEWSITMCFMSRAPPLTNCPRSKDRAK